MRAASMLPRWGQRGFRMIMRTRRVIPTPVCAYQTHPRPPPRSVCTAYKALEVLAARRAGGVSFSPCVVHA